MVNLSIIILSYNTKALTLKCIESIVGQYKKELSLKELEIIVVDNASTDGSPSAISNFKLIQNKENVGFARGCNIGADSAEGKYILFLNSDTEVLDEGFLSMTDFLDKNSDVAILGGKLENNDGSIQRSCGKFYNLFNLLIMLLGLERFGFLRSSPGKIQKVDWVSGACMMVRADIFEKLTGFDEKLFMYMEDMEVCFRAKKLGFGTYFYPDVKLRHKSLGSSNRTFAIIYIYKGILHFYSRHKTYLEYLAAKLLLITKAGILILVGLLTFNSELKDRYQKAISENL
ncbi:MAG: glycosyltransferase family 2 protein [Candidatus Levybacteria bacterium]|nr:glycosyltransferase family 2 protein [Candidatus Levybacteria bacterium]